MVTVQQKVQFVTCRFPGVRCRTCFTSVICNRESDRKREEKRKETVVTACEESSGDEMRRTGRHFRSLGTWSGLWMFKFLQVWLAEKQPVSARKIQLLRERTAHKYTQYRYMEYGDKHLSHLGLELNLHQWSEPTCWCDLCSVENTQSFTQISFM